ncbi:type II secretion system protein GspD [Leptotrichia alba]|uniref:Type II secretion system protein GspD n=1 Tax=Leptotrichia alba TaxID=3239304 RepID=A0AB39V2N8_9FUSO
MERKRKNFKLFTVLFLIFYIVGNNSFGAKTSDYVNKTDVENAKKIFIYEVPKKVQTEKKENSNKSSNNNQNNKNSNKNKNSANISKNNESTSNNNKNQVQNQVQPVKEKKRTGEIDLEYRNSKDITEKLNGFFGFEVIGIDNKVIFNGDESKIEEMRRIIKSLDKEKEQVIIKGTIIDTSSNLFERLGIDWSINSDNANATKDNLVAKFLNGEVSIASIFSTGGKFLGIDFNLLKENGDIRIEAMPTLMIMENEEGELKVTEEVLVGEKKTTKKDTEYVEPIFSEAGIVFKINPEIRKINGIKKILLKIDTEISNFKLTSSYNASSGAKQKNQTKTTITLNNGGSTFIGGLKQDVSKETIRRVPVLSKIPIVGPLFKYRRTNRELRDIYIEIEAVIQEKI